MPVPLTCTSPVAQFFFFIRDCSVVDDARQFPPSRPIRDLTMMVGSHRAGLRIEIGDLPEKFYNERKKAAMELSVKLVNEKNEIVRDRYVPLKALLLYEGGKEVYDQKILHSKNIRMAVDRTGQATLNFRIEDVSKNHQKQQFVIQLSPDIVANPDNADIYPGTTTPVCAMSKNPEDRCGSKKNMKRRKENSSDDDSDDESDYRSNKAPRIPGECRVADLLCCCHDSCRSVGLRVSCPHFAPLDQRHRCSDQSPLRPAIYGCTYR